MPTTSDGLAGLMERILPEVFKRLPPMIRSYSRPSCPRTFSMAERILRTLSSLVKSTNDSFLDGPSSRRTCKRGGASMVAIGDPFQDGSLKLTLARIFATFNFTPDGGDGQTGESSCPATLVTLSEAKAPLYGSALANSEAADRERISMAPRPTPQWKFSANIRVSRASSSCT